jgi:hypothetical protein
MRLNLVKKRWVALVAGAGVLVLLFISFADWPLKSDTTLGNISRLGLEVHTFYEANHRLPSNLEELKVGPRLRNDGWGRPITYMVTSSNSYVLRSFGPGGKLGKDNMVYSFDASDVSGVPVR